MRRGSKYPVLFVSLEINIITVQADQTDLSLWPFDNDIPSNFNSSNTDGPFTMAVSNSVLSPYEILPIEHEKYLGVVKSYFIMKLYVVCTH